MLNTIRGWFKPELTDPADIRELNKTLDLQEINLDSMNGYEFAKDILTTGDSVEIGKIHLNKIPADPDFGKQFLVNTGTLWSNATKEEISLKTLKDKTENLFSGSLKTIELGNDVKMIQFTTPTNTGVVIYDYVPADFGLTEFFIGWSCGGLSGAQNEDGGVELVNSSLLRVSNKSGTTTRTCEGFVIGK